MKQMTPNMAAIDEYKRKVRSTYTPSLSTSCTQHVYTHPPLSLSLSHALSTYTPPAHTHTLTLTHTPSLTLTRTQEELHAARLGELDAITTERDAARKRFEELRKLRLDQFMTGFSTITYKLKEMYQVCVIQWKSSYYIERGSNVRTIRREDTSLNRTPFPTPSTTLACISTSEMRTPH